MDVVIVVVVVGGADKVLTIPPKRQSKSSTMSQDKQQSGRSAKQEKRGKCHLWRTKYGFVVVVARRNNECDVALQSFLFDFVE